MGLGVHAAMQWAPEHVGRRANLFRADYNRRHSQRYSPLQFLEENKGIWEDYCRRLGGEPKDAAFPWFE